MTTLKKTKELTRESYFHIAPLYKRDFDQDYSDLKILVDAAVNHLRKNRLQGEILDLGCGTGILTRYLRQHGIKNSITGVDFTASFLTDYAKEFPQNKAINSDITQFLRQIRLSNCAGIFFNWSFFHIPEEETEEVISRCHSLLYPEGILYMSLQRGTKIGFEINPYVKNKDPRLQTDKELVSYIRYYTKKTIQEKLEANNFEIIKIKIHKIKKISAGDFLTNKIYVLAKK